jgi:excisionase family DNA binding protein
MTAVSIKTTEPYLTTAEAAALLGLETETVKRYCNMTPQRIHGEKFGNGWMIPESAIKDYQRQNRDSRGRPRNSDK